MVATTLPQAYGATQPYAPCGYTPTQLRGAYGTTSLIENGTDGRGQTVAIIDAYASPTIFADVNHWSANRGIAPLAPSQFAQIVPPGIFNKPQSNAQELLTVFKAIYDLSDDVSAIPRYLSGNSPGGGAGRAPRRRTARSAHAGHS